jgi:hypothetical protein
MKPFCFAGELSSSSALEVRTTLTSNDLIIEGDGWKNLVVPLKVDCSQSSQFAIAVFTSASCKQKLS